GEEGELGVDVHPVVRIVLGVGDHRLLLEGRLGVVGVEVVALRAEHDDVTSGSAVGRGGGRRLGGRGRGGPGGGGGPRPGGGRGWADGGLSLERPPGRTPKSRQFSWLSHGTCRN